jgi:hypothetical protein
MRKLTRRRRSVDRSQDVGCRFKFATNLADSKVGRKFKAATVDLFTARKKNMPFFFGLEKEVNRSTEQEPVPGHKNPNLQPASNLSTDLPSASQRPCFRQRKVASRRSQVANLWFAGTLYSNLSLSTYFPPEKKHVVFFWTGEGSRQVNRTRTGAGTQKPKSATCEQPVDQPSVSKSATSFSAKKSCKSQVAGRKFVVCWDTLLDLPCCSKG